MNDLRSICFGLGYAAVTPRLKLSVSSIESDLDILSDLDVTAAVFFRSAPARDRPPVGSSKVAPFPTSVCFRNWYTGRINCRVNDHIVSVIDIGDIQGLDHHRSRCHKRE
jgi:hypothetical protein